MENIFTFKSRSPFFEKEREGVKNNTVRKVDLDDNRFLELISWNEQGYNDGDIKIKIVRSDDQNDFFIRQIKDISNWGDLMIITWMI